MTAINSNRAIRGRAVGSNRFNGSYYFVQS